MLKKAKTFLLGRDRQTVRRTDGYEYGPGSGTGLQKVLVLRNLVRTMTGRSIRASGQEICGVIARDHGHKPSFLRSVFGCDQIRGGVTSVRLSFWAIRLKVCCSEPIPNCYAPAETDPRFSGIGPKLLVRRLMISQRWANKRYFFWRSL